MQYFRVTCFDRFRHYDQRRAMPWIKTYHDEILGDYRFTSLPERMRSHVIALRLLAAKTRNCLPIDQRYLRQQIAARSKIDLDELEKRGFIQYLDDDVASMLLADVDERASNALAQEKEKEEEKEKENRVVLASHEKQINGNRPRLAK